MRAGLIAITHSPYLKTLHEAFPPLLTGSMFSRPSHLDRKVEELNKRIAEYNQMKQQQEIEARRLQGLQQPSEQLTMQMELSEQLIVKQDARIEQFDDMIKARDDMIAVQKAYIDDLQEAINSRKCSGCGKQKQDVDRMYSLCCLCCHPIRPGQSIEEALASCKER